MTEHDDHDTEARLAWLVSDAVADVEPSDRLDELRARTSPGSRPAHRSWLYAGGGAVLATAAVITVIAMLTGGSRPAADPALGPGPAAQPSAATTAPGSPSSPSDPKTLTVASYYVGSTPRGPRLFREFDQRAGVGQLDTAIQSLNGAPTDPDYDNPWPEGSFAGASISSDSTVIEVDLVDAPPHDRPAQMSTDEAEMAVQQVVYTLQAAVQSRALVQFRVDGKPIDRVLGINTREPLTNAPQLEVLSHVSISDPAEGASATGSLQVTGAANSNEATLHWQLLAGDPVAEGSFTADGWLGEKLFAFSGRVDLTGVPPGRYTLAVQTDDPSGGAEGFGPDTDTRTVVVQ